MARVFDPSVFQVNVFQVGDVTPPVVETPEVGSSISGGQFTRGQWRKLQDEIERKARKALDDRNRDERRKRRLADEEAARKRQETEARRATEDLLIALRPPEVPQFSQTAPNWLPALARAAQEMQDEDEAVALLLLNQ